jgi:hypothetical protein
MTRLLDNKAHGKVGEVLAEAIRNGARLSILSGAFSVYAYSLLKKRFAGVSALRFLIPSDEFTAIEGGKSFRMLGLEGE